MNEVTVEIEIHKAREIVENLSEIEGMLKAVKMSDTVRRNIGKRIKIIKDSLQEAKLKGGGE